MVEKILSRSVRLMFTGGLVLGAQLAGAQEAAPMQKVEVTGTRIPTINVDGPSPVTVLSAKDIKVDGVRNVEDLLNNLPQVFADQGGQIVNGATGTATVALRGLGADRTLVLVNGKRLPAGSTNSSSADLNEIPTGLIKRVDILTGGAGAVYGSGAVAGVVNFILKDNFQGLEVQANVSGNNHKQQQDYVASVAKGRNYDVPGNISYDGKIQDLSILFGNNFADNKGNATLYFAYKKTDAILQAARDYSACSLASNKTGFTCSGSGTPALGRVGLTAGGGTFVADENGVTRPFVTASDQYNFGPINHLQRPSEQYLFNAQGHYDINDKVRVYEEFNYHSNHTNAQIAASGAFFGGIIATLSADNPLLTASWRDRLKLTTPGSTAEVFVGKRNIEGGGRVLDITDSSMRSVLGVKGEISNWTYDVFAQIGRVNRNTANYNYFDNNKINKALDVVVGANGEAVCRSFADGSDPACVPYNVYKKGGVTKAQTDYLSVTGLAGGFTQQTVLGTSFGSDLGNYGIKTPWAQSGVGVAFGAENRTESLGFVPDAATSEGSLAGSGGANPALSGKYSVKEYFGEVKVPLLEKRPFAESLELSGSYRNSEYSTGRKTNTYGLGLDYAPVKSVRIRGSFQQAVRAGTIFDLFTPKGVGLGGPANDPCEGDTPTASAAACANTGMTAALYGKTIGNAANQHNASFGGNVNVNPEKAKTSTIGIVVEPIKNFVITVDAFKIKIDGTIAAIDPTTVLTQCLTTGSPTFCSLIHRDKFGSLWLTNDGFIEGNTTNIGSVQTSGVDLAASYGMKLGTMGSLNLSMNGTLLDTLEIENIPGLGKYNCVGYYGQSCGTPTPKWKHKARATWATPWNLDASLTWRHINSVQHERLSANPLLTGTVNPIEQTISAREYFDLNAVYAVTKNLSLSAGVTNLFDKDPPVLSTNATSTAGAANGNTYPQVYESLGRKIYVNLTARF